MSEDTRPPALSDVVEGLAEYIEREDAVKVAAWDELYDLAGQVAGLSEVMDKILAKHRAKKEGK
jgi:hypothetical protein